MGVRQVVFMLTKNTESPRKLAALKKIKIRGGRYKPDSVPAFQQVTVISLLPGLRLVPLPKQGATNTRGYPTAFAAVRPRRAVSSVLSCTAWGLSCLLPYSRSGELLPRLFTLARRIAPHGGMFSVTLSVTGALRPQPPRLTRGMLPCGVRTFLLPPPCGDFKRLSPADPEEKIGQVSNFEC